MTKTIRNYGMLVTALLAFTLVFSTVTMANDGGKTGNITELKMIGKLENQPVFELNFTNVADEEFTVIFRDEHGNVLYTDKFKGANITKKFLLRADEMGEAPLHVIVKAKKSNITEVYTINRSTSYVEETVVNKVK
jgi:hypothetical protein